MAGALLRPRWRGTGSLAEWVLAQPRRRAQAWPGRSGAFHPGLGVPKGRWGAAALPWFGSSPFVTPRLPGGRRGLVGPGVPQAETQREPGAGSEGGAGTRNQKGEERQERGREEEAASLHSTGGGAPLQRRGLGPGPVLFGGESLGSLQPSTPGVRAHGPSGRRCTKRGHDRYSFPQHP